MTGESLYTIEQVVEAELQAEESESVRSLLARSFPWTKEFEFQPYWQVRPGIRFLARINPSRDIVGHLALFNRVIKVNNTSLKLAGLGLYAIEKKHRGANVSKGLISESHKKIFESGYDASVVFTKHGIVRRVCKNLNYIAIPGLFQFTYPDGDLVTKNDSFVLPLKSSIMDLFRSVGTICAGEGTW